jgi:FkbM family methyltransferase
MREQEPWPEGGWSPPPDAGAHAGFLPESVAGGSNGEYAGSAARHHLGKNLVLNQLLLRFADSARPLYKRLFSRKEFAAVHWLMLDCAQQGLGISAFPSRDAEFAFLKTYLAHVAKRGSSRPVVLDVGGYVGEYAVDARKASSQALIISFEPNPIAYERLAAEAPAWSFEAVNAGCGAEAGAGTLYDFATDEASPYASITREVIEDNHAELSKGKSRAHPVRLVRLDSFLEERGIDSVDLLKVDVEGHELDVFKGAERSIAAGKIGCIQFELNEMNVLRRVFFRDFVQALPGYKFFRLLASGELLPLPYWARGCEVFVFQNVIAMREDLAATFVEPPFGWDYLQKMYILGVKTLYARLDVSTRRGDLEP